MSAMRARGQSSSVRGRAALCMHAVCVLANGRSRKSNVTEGFPWRLCACMLFVDCCQFRRAGMSYRVYYYSLSGGGSIDWVPGVPLAAWGGPRRTQGAVRAAPKMEDLARTRVNTLHVKL
jgi:hypothetical protein